MTLAQLLDRFETVERSIVVVNRTDPDPVRNMLVDTFGDDAVQIVERAARNGSSEPQPRVDAWADATTMQPAGDGDSGRTDSAGDTEGRLDPAVLRDHDAVPFDGDSVADAENLALLVEDDAVIAGSSLEELGRAVLFVNSDLYITGARSLDSVALPRVITGLEDTRFTLQGYPESNRQKLLLVTISRFIERVAWTAADGTIRSSFQRLSRIDDELGTRRVYERLSEAGVQAHLYGVPDDPPTGLDAAIHGGRSADFTDSRFVLFEPPDGFGGVAGTDEAPGIEAETDEADLERGVQGGVGLLAVETEPRRWEGTWTFDPAQLRALRGYIKRNL